MTILLPRRLVVEVVTLEALKAAAGKELGSDPDFGSSVQQDAHEFLAKTLEILEKEALRLKKFSQPTSNGLAEKASSPSAEKYISPISSSRNPAGVFQHKIRDRYGCERCARASEMTNDAIDLTVTVSAGESIQKMIEHALAREEIEYKCDNCGPAGGSKVDEKIGVSRELFLKDLYVDSEVKRQEGVARQSVSQSLSHCIGNGTQNGYLENSGKASQMSAQEEGSVASQDEAMTTSSVSFLSTDQEENNDYLFETSRTSDKVEKSITASSSVALGEKTAAAATFPVSAPESSPLVQQRVALSPLKMNRSATVMLEKPVHREKENVFGGRKDVALGIEAEVVKQSGGYLKEDLPEKETHSSTSDTSEELEQDVNLLHIDDDVPKKRSRMDGAEDGQAKDRSASTPNRPDGLYARMITEPLRPSSRPSSTKPSEQPQLSTPSIEQISVLGEFEEKTTLIFRPVTEDVQKRWCSRFGFKYIGSPDLRKRTFGREVEFSLRDMPLSCEVRGDGNCLFRTLSWWITGGNEGQHFRLREKLVSFMAQYCTKFSSLLQSQQEMENHLQ
ncbi:unnamed protein product [Heligmosomoides polygyrus]|uniref:OTU domain-containing protein n=1 Tax=Heligmosomoides polygyrus TaxID=6339 RepID=A0A183GMC2_HELPZ|nr:unnamed protein product [Heligmosomoides polygyrus]